VSNNALVFPTLEKDVPDNHASYAGRPLLSRIGTFEGPVAWADVRRTKPGRRNFDCTRTPNRGVSNVCFGAICDVPCGGKAQGYIFVSSFPSPFFAHFLTLFCKLRAPLGIAITLFACHLVVSCLNKLASELNGNHVSDHVGNDRFNFKNLNNM
jgi:hypothetical protein